MSQKQDELPSVTTTQLRRAGELTTDTRSIRVSLGEAERVVGVELRRFPNGGHWWLLVCLVVVVR
jgi:hypothetical protein